MNTYHTIPLPPGYNPIAVNKHYYYYYCKTVRMWSWLPTSI